MMLIADDIMRNIKLSKYLQISKIDGWNNLINNIIDREQ